jgi:hypothetical protein
MGATLTYFVPVRGGGRALNKGSSTDRGGSPRGCGRLSEALAVI